MRLTGDDVADRLAWSTAKVSRIENARTGAKIPDVQRLLDLYDVHGDRRDDLLALARDAGERGWWEDYRDLPRPLADFIALESEAGAIRQWESGCVPGLVQTKAYARRLTEGFNELSTMPPQEITRRVEIRMKRQDLLHWSKPPNLLLVIDEAVLKRRVGDAEVMREQLDHLVRIGDLPHVTLQVLPLDAPHNVVVESFTLLEFPPAYEVTFPDIVHTESITISHSADERFTHMYRLAHNSLATQALTPAETRQRIIEARDLW
ncbi:transcriptional regulator with XRE-family HTH domain [Actinomadura algeriensis]|uniref:Transcriptional regulator with XRE-family HTH domain n=2 Tax=Actinomadura algeriensis TaxID=1679523 RepID=A0ABR9JLP9_9ACTN|nr:transcriptional regulator with XRE-family HTH domain [Actinomadura algeriensis]